MDTDEGESDMQFRWTELKIKERMGKADEKKIIYRNTHKHKKIIIFNPVLFFYQTN